jgi:diamine N-acetyltransferase
MNIEIRKAHLEDAEFIALLGRITFRESFAEVWNNEKVLSNYFNKTFAVAKIRASLQKENNIYWLAFADDLPVGYIKMKKFSPYEKLSDEKPAQLQKIYVLNEFIGKGIGEKLQNAAFDEVAANRIKTMWLAVLQQNEKAQHFYKKHGFHQATDYRFTFETLKFEFAVMVKIFKI